MVKTYLIFVPVFHFHLGDIQYDIPHFLPNWLITDYHKPFQEFEILHLQSEIIHKISKIDEPICIKVWHNEGDIMNFRFDLIKYGIQIIKYFMTIKFIEFMEYYILAEGVWYSMQWYFFLLVRFAKHSLRILIQERFNVFVVEFALVIGIATYDAV